MVLKGTTRSLNPSICLRNNVTYRPALEWSLAARHSRERRSSDCPLPSLAKVRLARAGPRPQWRPDACHARQCVFTGPVWAGGHWSASSRCGSYIYVANLFRDRRNSHAFSPPIYKVSIHEYDSHESSNRTASSPGAASAPDDGRRAGFPPLVRHPQDPHRRTEGRGRRAVRRRGPASCRAGKKLLDTPHPAYKAVTAVRGKVIAYWKSMIAALPGAGHPADPAGPDRRVRRARCAEFQEELAEAVENLDRHYSELKTAARQRLGSLYNAGDYPESLRGTVRHRVRFPQRRAAGLSPAAQPASSTKQECQRVQARFDEAVRLAEEAFTAELAKLVSHLDRAALRPGGRQAQGLPGSAVENLTEFFQRFRQLNVRSNEQLDQLVADAQRVIRGVEPQDLRDNAGLRQHVATEMSRVQSVLDGLLVDRPRRNILRRPK